MVVMAANQESESKIENEDRTEMQEEFIKCSSDSSQEKEDISS